jgi:hypothetical protein
MCLSVVVKALIGESVHTETGDLQDEISCLYPYNLTGKEK